MSAAHQDDGDHGASCIFALFQGEDSNEAEAGAFLLAEGLAKWMRTPTLVG